MQRFHKAFCCIMTGILLLSLCACSIFSPQKTIAVVVHEDMPAQAVALLLAQVQETAYADAVKTVTYRDAEDSGTQASSSTLEQVARDLASDNKIGAILFYCAAGGAADAIQTVRGRNAELLIGCICPQEDLPALQAVSDFVLVADYWQEAQQVVQCAVQQGAKRLVQYTNDRLQANALYVSQRAALELACVEQGLQYQFVNAIDTQGAQKEFAEDFILEDIYRKSEEGIVTAFYTSDPQLQAAVIGGVKQNADARYPAAFSTSVYVGYLQALELEERYKTEQFEALRTQITNKLGGSKQRFALPDYPAEYTALYVALSYASRYLSDSNAQIDLTLQEFSWANQQLLTTLELDGVVYSNCYQLRGVNLLVSDAS